ncbi:MAG TPA: hypothetical protein VFP44_24765 [Usitatibacter sp.]|nr:hypothetical protein [Usitatibacter sp.]
MATPRKWMLAAAAGALLLAGCADYPYGYYDNGYYGSPYYDYPGYYGGPSVGLALGYGEWRGGHHRHDRDWRDHDWRWRH